VANATPPRAQTTGPSAPRRPSHPQFRLLSRPDLRHASHSQPAWWEN